KSVVLGYGLGDAKAGLRIEAGIRCVLAQEIRNARGGQYTFALEAMGEASSEDEFVNGFLANFTCRLILFRFRNTNKDPREAIELAAREFQPEFGKAGRFSLHRFLGSRGGGVNFSIGNGLGVAVVVEKKTPGQLTFPPNEPHLGAIRIRSVYLALAAPGLAVGDQPIKELGQLAGGRPDGGADPRACPQPTQKVSQHLLQ